MSPNAKERLIHSIAGGAVIPAAYFLALPLLLVVGVSLSHVPLVRLPLVWPAYLYKFFVPAFDVWVFDAEALLLMVVANFVLYSLLTYAVIRWRQRMPRLR